MLAIPERRSNRIKLNIKVNEVFEPLFQPARYKGAYGGRGSGKSWCFAEMLVHAVHRRARHRSRLHPRGAAHPHAVEQAPHRKQDPAARRRAAVPRPRRPHKDARRWPHHLSGHAGSHRRKHQVAWRAFASPGSRRRRRSRIALSRCEAAQGEELAENRCDCAALHRRGSGGCPADGKERLRPAPGDRERKARSQSSHYIVGRDGTVVHCVRHKDIAYHANNENASTIGIEHKHDFPPIRRSLASSIWRSAELVVWLGQQLGIPMDRWYIWGHSEIDTTTTHQPAQRALDWDTTCTPFRTSKGPPRVACR